MNKQQLLTRANQFSGSRYGVSVTPRKLGDWVSEGLVPGPSSHGNMRGVSPTRDWSLLSYRRILQICRLQKMRFTRFDEFRIALWMNGVDIPIETLRNALADEFSRAKKLTMRAINSTWDPRDTKPLTAHNRNALLKQMGKGHPGLLPEGFLIPNALMIDLSGWMRYGIGQNNSVAMFTSELGKHLGLSEQDGSTLFGDMAGFLLMLNCLAGDPDEIINSGENSINKASDDTFEAARAICQKFPFLLNNAFERIHGFPPEFQNILKELMGPLRLISSTVRTKSWQPAWLGMWVHYFHQKDDSEKLPDEIKSFLTDHMSIS